MGRFILFVSAKVQFNPICPRLRKFQHFKNIFYPHLSVVTILFTLTRYTFNKNEDGAQ